MILLIPNSFQMFVVDISLRHQNLQMCFFLSAKCVCVCVPPCYKKTHVFVLTLEKNQCGLEATEKKRHADKFHTHTHTSKHRKTPGIFLKRNMFFWFSRFLVMEFKVMWLFYDEMALFHCHPSLSSLGSAETRVVVLFQGVEGFKGKWSCSWRVSFTGFLLSSVFPPKNWMGPNPNRALKT